MTQTIASLTAAHIGRTVIRTDKTGAETRYTVSKLSDKLGTLKDGSKGEYVILTKDGETGTVINMHPNTAKKLLTKGDADGLSLLIDLKTEPADEDPTKVMKAEQAAAAHERELDAAEQADVKAELAAEQGETDDGTVDKIAAMTGISAAQLLAEADMKGPVDGAPVEPAKAAKAPSKKDRTVAIFKAMAGSARKDIITKMKADLGLSDAGANTYYQNCKSGAWA